MTRRLAAALTVLTVALSVSSCGGPASDGRPEHKPTDQPVITGQPAGYNADDVTFATAMIPHHQQALQMSALVADRTTNQKIIALANQISAAQQPQIEAMKVFLVQWKENPDANSGDPGHGSAMTGTVDEATMAKLRSSTGTEFDQLWLQSMIGHHRAAVAMAQAEIADGRNVDAIALAKNIVNTQEAEIGQMTQLLGG